MTNLITKVMHNGTQYDIGGVTSVNGQTGAVTVDTGDAKVFEISSTVGAEALATAQQAYDYAYTEKKCSIIKYVTNFYVCSYVSSSEAYFSCCPIGYGSVSSGNWEKIPTLKLTISSGSVTALTSTENRIKIASVVPTGNFNNEITYVI